MEKLPYSIKTKKLIDRQCKNVERKDFRLYKAKRVEAILKTYDLFGLKRPSRIIWCKDIFDPIFDNAAGSAGSARSAWSAWSAMSAMSAWSAGSAMSARSAMSALDYDFDWYVFEFEYCQNPDKGREPNENDYKYLEYCELLMQAKEYGVGYRVEWEDTLYLVPTPLVRIDDQNRWHSLTEPAIRWKGGSEFYYLWGVNFDKELWEKIANNTITVKEILSIENIEQRMAALKVKGAESLLEESKAKLVDTSKDKQYELYQLDGIFSQTAYFLKYACPSTGRVYVSGIDPEIGKKKSAIEAIAWKFSIPVEEYKNILAFG